MQNPMRLILNECRICFLTNACQPGLPNLTKFNQTVHLADESQIKERREGGRERERGREGERGRKTEIQIFSGRSN